MKRPVILGLAFSFLIFISSIAMFYQAVGGSWIEFDFGLSFEPSDLGNTTLFLALLLAPFWVASQNFGKRKRLSRLAPLASLFVLLAFPMPIHYQLPSHHGFGFRPFWQRMKGHDPADERYETSGWGQRYEFEGNLLWSRGREWHLIDAWWTDEGRVAAVDEPGKSYECVLKKTASVLGFYWRDDHDYWRRTFDDNTLMNELEPRLRKGDCQLIPTPNVGSERR